MSTMLRTKFEVLKKWKFERFKLKYENLKEFKLKHEDLKGFKRFEKVSSSMQIK